MIRTTKTTKKTIAPKFVLMLAGVLIVVLGVIFFSEYANQKQLDGEISELNAEIERLKLKKENFLTLIDRYQSDFYVEEEARTKMNLKRPGEQVVVIKLNEVGHLASLTPTSATSADQPTTAINEESSFVLWWNYFFR